MAHTVINTTGAKHQGSSVRERPQVAAKLTNAAETSHSSHVHHAAKVPVKHGHAKKHGAKGMHLKHVA